MLCLILGKRLGFGSEPMKPHSMVLCMVGTGMLWVGWYGFNAGSALAADGIASNAFTTTTIAAAFACFTWGAAEYLLKGKPSILGFCSGAVAGLVVITPAAGFVDPIVGAPVIGLLAGLVPFLACTKLKEAMGYDDALDTFGVHAVGGTLGAILTGVLATASVNGNLTAANTLANPELVRLVKQGGLAGGAAQGGGPHPRPGRRRLDRPHLRHAGCWSACARAPRSSAKASTSRSMAKRGTPPRRSSSW